MGQHPRAHDAQTRDRRIPACRFGMREVGNEVIEARYPSSSVGWRFFPNIHANTMLIR